MTDVIVELAPGSVAALAAAASASEAATSATNAATSATNAATSASAAATSATNAANSATNAAASAAAAAAATPNPGFLTVSAMAAAANGLEEGNIVDVAQGYNGAGETFRIVSAGTFTANGAEVVALTVSGVQAVSTRLWFTSYADFIADTRTHAVGTRLHVHGTGFYDAVSSGGNLDSPNAAGQEFDVVDLPDGSVTMKHYASVAPGQAADATAAIQYALDNFSTTTIQNGYRVDGVLEPRTAKPLILKGDGALTRYSAHSVSTGPVVWLSNTRSVLVGDGRFSSRITSQNRTPRGVIQVGPESYTTASTNIQGCTIQGLFLEGKDVGGRTDAGTPDCIIFMTANEAAVGGPSTNFYHSFHDIRMSQANIGCRMTGNVNMNAMNAIYAQNLGDSADGVAHGMLYIEGALDNVFSNWTLTGSSGTTMIVMKDQGALRPSANTMTGMVCEQGGGGLFIDTSTGFTGTNNVIIGSGNTSPALSLNSSFRADGNQLMVNGEFYSELVNVLGVQFPSSPATVTGNNTFNFYEQVLTNGWTPVIDSETPGTGRVTTIDSATRVRMGRFAYVTASCRLTTLGSGGSGNLVINGLPWPGLSDGNQCIQPVTVRLHNSGFASTVVDVQGYIRPGLTSIRLEKMATAAAAHSLVDFATYAQVGMGITIAVGYTTNS